MNDLMLTLKENGLCFVDADANMGVKDFGLLLTMAEKDVVVRYCMDAAIGRTCVEYTDAWEFVGFTYDGEEARLYRNGSFDARPGYNPYPGGLFDGGPDGADFTVGAVHRGGGMGNWFTGYLGGLLVCSTALTAGVILDLADQTVPGRSAETLNTMRACEANLDYTSVDALSSKSSQQSGV